jgi:hypothetical protein
VGYIAIVQDSDARVTRILTPFIGPYLAILMPFLVICLLMPSDILTARSRFVTHTSLLAFKSNNADLDTSRNDPDSALEKRDVVNIYTTAE